MKDVKEVFFGPKGLNALPPLRVLPFSYLHRRSVRFVMSVFGPRYPFYLWYCVSLLLLFGLILAWVISRPRLDARWFLLAPLTTAFGFFIGYIDENHTPLPKEARPHEIRRIDRRIGFASLAGLVSVVIGLGGAYAFFGEGSLVAVGSFVILGFTMASIWVFLSSRLEGCETCRGLTLHRTYEGRWVCLRCGEVEP